MRRSVTLLLTALLVLFTAVAVLASADGPAPNSGDGISDGSGFETPPGPEGDGSGDAFGPAPNAGDGVPDGSGLEPPNGRLR